MTTANGSLAPLSFKLVLLVRYYPRWNKNAGLPAGYLSSQEVLNFISSKYLQKVDPSTPEEFNGFVEYIERVRNALIVDVTSGSLILMIECSSLEILEGLWEDYSTGYLNEMAQKFLVTAELLRTFGLAKIKLTTTIKEEQYRACHKLLSKIAGMLMGNLNQC